MFSETTLWQQGKTPDSSWTNLMISPKNLELKLRNGNLCMWLELGWKKLADQKEPYALRSRESAAVGEKEIISRGWGGRNRGCSQIPFFMSLSAHEFLDSLGGGYLSFWAPSFRPLFPKTPSHHSSWIIFGSWSACLSLQKLQRARPPCSRCSIAQAASRASLTTFEVLKELQEVRRGSCSDSQWSAFSCCRMENHSCGSCCPESCPFPSRGCQIPSILWAPKVSSDLWPQMPRLGCHY